MKFYMTPGSCSTGIHILLEELELVFEVYLVNLIAGDHLKPENLAVNPKATIPTLVRDDGSAITEFQAIAWWLARAYPNGHGSDANPDDKTCHARFPHPNPPPGGEGANESLRESRVKAKLLPDDIEGEMRVIETLDYVVGTIHGSGYTRIFTTDNYSSNTTEHPAIQARGREIVSKGFSVMNEVLAGKEYVVGDFSIADAALFYVEFWAVKIKLELPPNCLAHYQRMLQRPAVRRVLMEEGYRV